MSQHYDGELLRYDGPSFSGARTVLAGVDGLMERVWPEGHVEEGN